VCPTTYTNLGVQNSAAGSYELNRAVYTKTYATDGPYVVSSGSCCRISTLTNAPNGNWLFRSVVNLANGNSFSPVSGIPAVVAFKKGTITTTLIPNNDLDSSFPLTCALQTTAYGIPSYPVGLSVSSNCILTFDTTSNTINVGNTFAVDIVVTDTDPLRSSEMNIDFMIVISNNGSPSCTPSSQSVSVTCCGGSCQTSTTSFSVLDPDGDTVSWSLLTPPTGHSVAPGSNVPSGSNAVITFVPPGGWVGPVSSGTLRVVDSVGNVGFCPYNFNSLSSVLTVTITPTIVGACNALPGPYALACSGNTNAALSTTVQGACNTVTYTWSPGGQTTSSLSGLGAGTYTVTASDGVQTSSATYTVTSPTAYGTTLTLNSAAYSCGHFQCNGQASASLQLLVSPIGSCNLANPAPFLSWTSAGSGIGNNVYTPTGLVAGTYTATFHDSNNCLTTKSITLSEPSALSVSLTQTGNCGGATLLVSVSGGCPGYSISWTSNSGVTPSGFNPSSLPSGTYTATVTDANGCQIVRNYVVNYTPLTVSIDAVDKTCGHITCDESMDGALLSSVSGSCAPYTYVWTSSPGATVIPSGTVNPTGLSTGSYRLTVTDNGGNSRQSNVEVMSAPADLMISITQYPKACGHITCRGSNDARLTVTQLAPGCGSVTLSWASTGTAISNNNYNPTNLAPGTYTPSVSDANGCVFTASPVVIFQPATLLTASVTQYPKACGQITCNGNTDGRLLVTPSGGCPGYSISWVSTGTPVSNGVFNPTNLGIGTYTPTVTDQNGCTYSPGTFTIGQPPSPISASITQPSCRQLVLTVSGGCSPYSYSWTTTGGSGLVPTSKDQSNLSPGTYQVVVSDSNGCTATRSFTIAALTIDSGASIVASEWGNTGTPPVVGSPWVRGPAVDQVTSGTMQFAIYPSDFTVLQTSALSLTVNAITSSQTGFWGIAMGYNGPAQPYYLLTWNAVSSIVGCGTVNQGLRLLYVPAGVSACNIAQINNGVILLESSSVYPNTPWPAMTPFNLVVSYNTVRNTIRMSVGGIAQFLFASRLAHAQNAAIPSTLIAGGKWGLMTYNQDNILFSKLARDVIVTSCPDAALATVQKGFTGVSQCSAANSDISVDWGDSTLLETYTGGSAIIGFNAGTNTGTIRLQHRYESQGSYTVTVCILASFGSAPACDTFTVSVSDLYTLGVTSMQMLMYTKGELEWDISVTGVNPMIRGELHYKPANGGGFAFLLGTSSYSSGEMHFEAIHSILPGKYDMHMVLVNADCDFADSPVDFCVYLPYGKCT